jgi:N-acetyl-1-D-myo-inositol-2-amino-2-deoxy-alpha-D-glucopyranoside deacetylase
MTKKKTLLAVLAHPDDETFGMGGTLALYAHQGVDVHLITATNGDVGEVDPKYMKGFKSIAERRISELKCAAKLLGISKLHFLNYRDSGMAGTPDNKNPKALAAQPIEKVAAQVAHIIREIKPQVVITFDPIGGYYHPDHIASHKAAVLGFKMAADKKYKDKLTPWQVSKLYFSVFPHGFLKVAVFVTKLIGKDPAKWGRNGDIDMESIAKVSYPVNARINYREVAHLKDDASACHASQGGMEMTRGFLGWFRHIFQSNETFMRDHPRPARRSIERDLFAGID